MTLQTILIYHVVAGKFSAKKLIKRITKENRKAAIKTAREEQLPFLWEEKTLMFLLKMEVKQKLLLQM
jgi:uncharacterized surface protein with fasciclin (FAS1) repeats